MTPWTVANQAPLSAGFLFCDLMNCSQSSSFVHGISQARVLELVAISSSRGSSRPGDQTRVLYHCTTWEAQGNGDSQPNYLGTVSEEGLPEGTAALRLLELNFAVASSLLSERERVVSAHAA